MKKQFTKMAFTLAETLIVIGIIGVVAALTIPNTISDGKDRQYITKLAKFNTTLESATTAYIATKDKDFTSDDAVDFIKTSLIFVNTDEKKKIKSGSGLNAALKDGTVIDSIRAGNSSSDLDKIDTDNTGDAAFVIGFKPEVAGMAHKTLSFVVTEKGYVFPQKGDACLTSLYESKWKYEPAKFKSKCS